MAAIVAAVAAAVFWRTAYPTITWWDSSSYSLAAATLGVNSPPGSLLLTLIGWPVARLSFGLSPAHALNLFAGLLAALTSALVYVISLASLRIAGFDGRANTRDGARRGGRRVDVRVQRDALDVRDPVHPVRPHGGVHGFDFVDDDALVGRRRPPGCLGVARPPRPPLRAGLQRAQDERAADPGRRRLDSAAPPGDAAVAESDPVRRRFARGGTRGALAPRSNRRAHQLDPQLLRSEQSPALLGLRDDQAARRIVPARSVPAQVADLVVADDGRAARARPRFSERRRTGRGVGSLAGGRRGVGHRRALERQSPIRRGASDRAPAANRVHSPLLQHSVRLLQDVRPPLPAHRRDDRRAGSVRIGRGDGARYGPTADGSRSPLWRRFSCRRRSSGATGPRTTPRAVTSPATTPRTPCSAFRRTRSTSRSATTTPSR